LTSRHGVYAYSSKDWHKIKKDIMKEDELIKIEEEKSKPVLTEIEIEHQKLEKAGLEIKNKILP
jgi:hypothetical protein